MRLKPADGPLSVHNTTNGNPDILNSPKRLNTHQNTNLTSNFSCNVISQSTTTTGITGDELTSNTVNVDDAVQWCNSPRLLQKNRETVNNVNNRNRALFNINNTLDTSLTNLRQKTAPSICSVSSPDDSLLDYEEAQQSCSSVDSTPQDEERDFDISDSESISEEGNLSNQGTLQRRGIVNPNYPGFQHLAHTLDYGIKASSDTDFTDDDYDCEPLTVGLNAQANHINNINNNNPVDDTEYHIDGVNRLDSVENIQKVFYDKSVFNIPLECENIKLDGSNSSSASNQPSDDDLEVRACTNIEFNIKAEEPAVKLDDIVDARESVPRENASLGEEFGEAALVNKITNPRGEEFPVSEARIIHERAESFIERNPALNELQEAVEKISVSDDIVPAVPEHTSQPTLAAAPAVLNDSVSIVQETMATLIHPSRTQPDLSETKPDIKLLCNADTDNYLERKTSDAFLSLVQDTLPQVHQKMFDPDNDMAMQTDGKSNDSNRNEERQEPSKLKRDDFTKRYEREKFCKEEKTKDDKEKDEDSAVPRKKEKMETNYVKMRRDYNQQTASLITIPRRDLGNRNRDTMNRRSVPVMRDKKRSQAENFAGFDVYNIETSMPKIDLEAIESHLRAAREEERRRRTDREEIRRRLAMGSEDDYYNGYERPGRKPSLQARLQSGMNLQICFMNETVSDTESPNSDSECPVTNSKPPKKTPRNINTKLQQEQTAPAVPPTRPATLSIGQPLLQPVTQPMSEVDFFTRQARLQTEARMALAQAKEMARMQMEIERQRQKKSPITEMVRNSLEKVGIPFPEEKRRLSRQILTEMNVAQLQVIVNDLHTQIEILNENLVKYLMDRDDLHMEQDSMLVDIEDLTRYLGAKEQTIKDHSLGSQSHSLPPPSPAPSSPLAALNTSVKPHLHRIASLVKK